MSGAPKSLTILGATGSIGSSTLRIVRAHPKRFQVAVLTAQDNVESLIEIAREFRPKLAVIGNAKYYIALQQGLAGLDIEVAAGQAAILDAVARPSDMVVAAIVGTAGLAPVMTAIKRGATIALANKESLVAAGMLVMNAAVRYGAVLLPVDSEHNAIFQIYHARDNAYLDKITLTASGGPLRTWSVDALQRVTPAQAVAHPNWSMGAKISVDSATLMNKGLELIEAMHLFALAPEKLGVVVHPQSIIHGLAHYQDGSVLAQMGLPDMITPIAVCLAYPERFALDIPKLDLAALKQLDFEAPDEARFPCLRLAIDAMRTGGGVPTILNAANETAVAKFLAGEIGFTDIARHIEMVLERLHREINAPLMSLEDVLALDALARK